MYEQQIRELRTQGFGYTKIAQIVGCSRSLVRYYAHPQGREQQSKRHKKRRAKHPFVRKLDRFKSAKHTPKDREPRCSTKTLIRYKIYSFCRNRKTRMYEKPTFTVDDVIAKFGENPCCYLTGDPININQPRTYHFDHIIPVSRGGTNTLDNLGICTKQANQAKGDMTPDELLEFCRKVIQYSSG